MASRGKLDVFDYSRWRRPNRSRMYDYNYQYARSYYKPQVSYIGEAAEPQSRVSRRRAIAPPGARTFSERWAADPFYGRWDPVSRHYSRPPIILSQSRFGRASSVPADLDTFVDQGIAYGRSSMSRARSMTRETSVMREASLAPSTVRARSMTRARSVSRARSVFAGQEEETRSVRGRSMTPHYEEDYYFEPLSDAEWEKLMKFASKDEREKSIFQMRMSLENPRDLPKKKMMTTSLNHGVYQNSLYGTITWDPTPYISGRQ